MNNVVPMAQPATFEDFWNLYPKACRQKMALCQAKWNQITNGGLTTRTLDKDSGQYVEIELQATGEEIIAGLKRLVDAEIDTVNFNKTDWRYFVRSPQFLNQGRWMDG